MPDLWLLTAACAAVTYLPRAVGVLLAGRIRADSEIFRWIACVAYAMIAGLIVRTMVLPSGMLAETFLLDRAIACGLGVAAYFAGRRNLIAGVVIGVGALIAFGYLRSMMG